MHRALALLMPALAAGLPACGYRPGSLENRSPGREHATVGCLDVAVAGRWAAAGSAPVVEIDFANRCDRSILVDFRSLRASGRDVGGRAVPLAVFDPAREIRPLGLEARSVGREALELRGPPDRQVRTACLDVGGLAGSASGPRWLCVGRAANKGGGS